MMSSPLAGSKSWSSLNSEQSLCFEYFNESKSPFYDKSSRYGKQKQKLKLNYENLRKLEDEYLKRRDFNILKEIARKSKY